MIKRGNKHRLTTTIPGHNSNKLFFTTLSILSHSTNRLSPFLKRETPRGNVASLLPPTLIPSFSSFAHLITLKATNDTITTTTGWSLKNDTTYRVSHVTLFTIFRLLAIIWRKNVFHKSWSVFDWLYGAIDCRPFVLIVTFCWNFHFFAFKVMVH